MARRRGAVQHLAIIDEEARDDGGLFARYPDAYEKKYDVRPDPSSPGDAVYRRPRVALGWSEKDFPESATRWEFADGD